MGKWFIERDGKEQGPYTFQKLKIRAATGTLRPDDLVRRDDTPNWIRAVSVKGLFGSEHPPSPVRPPPLPQRPATTVPILNSDSTTSHPPTTKPAHVADSPIFATETASDSSASFSAASPSHSSPVPEGISEALASGANDVMSSFGELANAAKGVGQIAAAKTRKTQHTQISLPRAFSALGEELFSKGEQRDRFTDLFTRIESTKGQLHAVAQPNATAVQQGAFGAGAAQLKATAQSAALKMKLDSLFRELGEKAFTQTGPKVGSKEVVTRITESKSEIERLDREIARLSSVKRPKFIENTIVIGLLLVGCFPIGLVFVWRHPKWSKNKKWIWTGACMSLLFLEGEWGHP